MPPVLAAAAIGAALGGAGLFTAFTIAGSAALAGAITYGGLAAAAYLLTPSAPSIGAFNPDTRSIIRQAITAARWVLGRSRIGGVLAYYLEPEEMPNDVHIMLAICEGPIEGIEAIYIEGERYAVNPEEGEALTLEGQEGITFRFYFDGAAGATALQEAPDSQWTADHKLTGIASVHVHLVQNDYGSDASKRRWQRVPNIEFVVKGIKITWPGQAVRTWTDNAAALRYWWLTSRREIPASAINLRDFAHAYAVSDFEVDNDLTQELQDAGYPARSRRYQVNTIINSTDAHETTEAEFDFAWAGWVVEQGGVHYFRPGADREPVANIGNADIIAPLSVVPAPALSDRINAAQMTLARLHRVRCPRIA